MGGNRVKAEKQLSFFIQNGKTKDLGCKIHNEQWPKIPKQALSLVAAIYSNPKWNPM